MGKNKTGKKYEVRASTKHKVGSGKSEARSTKFEIASAVNQKNKK